MALITVENIYKVYNMGDMPLEVLKNVSLEIASGEFVAIMGPSGSGKSTFMNILGCLDKPTRGRYILDGLDITGSSLTELADIRSRKIGFVFQGFNLLSRTSALENVELPMVYSHVPNNERKQKAVKALEAVGLGERIDHMPNQLSGGQQQRVAIARAIVNDAPIIFADEPTGNLDTKTSIEVMTTFYKLNRDAGKTIILVTHEQDIANYAKRIIRFKDGEVVCDEINNKRTEAE
ncbi:MAG: ABC transporter ATP-binding protein [Elusimicrobiota bacterium]|jgi:putative ABC transport system ATP-binding protein|nr:ABC transporter ATP-binding protein [Elusimicrobiota bacterium]